MEKLTAHQNRILSEKVADAVLVRSNYDPDCFLKNVIPELQKINEATSPDAPAILAMSNNTDREAILAATHHLLDEIPLTADDLVFLQVLIAAFWSVPPGSLFLRLRSDDESISEDELNQIRTPCRQADELIDQYRQRSRLSLRLLTMTGELLASLGKPGQSAAPLIAEFDEVARQLRELQRGHANGL